MSHKRLLFLHTGGTLGMTSRGDPGPLAPSAYAEDVLPFVRGLEELVHIEGEVLCNLDSSDLLPRHWEGLAALIAARLHDYDGFVVLHGTDTMAYTASALSYLLDGLPKPVVLTGAQRPIAELRTDARNNLIHASISATMDVPEVTVWFNDELLRGNRCTKVSVQSYAAFASPNLPPLVRMGADVVPQHTPRRPRGPFTLRSGFCEDVAVLWLFPGAPPKLLDLLVESGARGVVLVAFGAGNVPQRGWPEAIGRATQQGVQVVVNTQCVDGAVELGRYEGSAAAQAQGALSAGPMTIEASLTKLMFLLGQGLSAEGLRARFGEDLAGELLP